MSANVPRRSGVRIDTSVAPYELARTSMPVGFVSVNTSTARPSAVTPNGERPAVASIVSASAPSRATASQLDEIGNLDRPLLVDAVSDGNPGETRHRTRARVRKLHVFGHVGLAEDQVAHPVVAAAVPFEHLRHRDPGALPEALGDV